MSNPAYQDGKISIDSSIYDIPSGYEVTYSNMNSNLERRRQQRQNNDQELEMALNNSLLESIGISGTCFFIKAQTELFFFIS